MVDSGHARGGQQRDHRPARPGEGRGAAARGARGARPARRGRAAGTAPASGRTRSTRSARRPCGGSPSSPPSGEIPLHIHLSETEQEVDDCLDAHGRRPAALPRRARLPRPADRARARRLARRHELELIAERGATVVANPAANMKLAVGGVLPYPRGGRGRRPRSGSGTDGVSSNSNLDIVRGGEAVRPQPEARERRSLGAARRPRRWRSRAGSARRCSAGRRSRSESPPTSCCCAPRTRSSPPATSTPISSTPPAGSVVDTTVVAGEVLMRDRAGARCRGDRRGGPRPSRQAHRPIASPAVRTEARFPEIAEKAGHYESFYLKLVQPGGGRAAWIRHTVHKRPGEEATCALWFVLFDSSAAGPRATKRQFGADELSAAPGHLHPDRGRVAHRRPRHRPGRDRRAGGEAGTWPSRTATSPSITCRATSSTARSCRRPSS